jgi:hypothetical protein
LLTVFPLVALLAGDFFGVATFSSERTRGKAPVKTTSPKKIAIPKKSPLKETRGRDGKIVTKKVNTPAKRGTRRKAPTPKKVENVTITVEEETVMVTQTLEKVATPKKSPAKRECLPF